MVTPCRVCYSSYSKQIERLLDRRQQYCAIARCYAKRFGCGVHLLEQSLAVHKRHKQFFAAWRKAERKKQALWAQLTGEFNSTRPNLDLALKLLMATTQAEIWSNEGKAVHSLMVRLVEAMNEHEKLARYQAAREMLTPVFRGRAQ